MGFFGKAIIGIGAANLIGDAVAGKQVLNPFDRTDNIFSHWNAHKDSVANRKHHAQYSGAPTYRPNTVEYYAPEYCTGEYLIPVFDSAAEFREFAEVADDCHRLEAEYARGDKGLLYFDDNGVGHPFGSPHHLDRMRNARAALEEYFPPAQVATSFDDEVAIEEPAQFVARQTKRAPLPNPWGDEVSAPVTPWEDIVQVDDAEDFARSLYGSNVQR